MILSEVPVNEQYFLDILSFLVQDSQIFPVRHEMRDGRVWAANRFLNCAVTFCLP
jgi:hypothetical protein